MAPSLTGVFYTNPKKKKKKRKARRNPIDPDKALVPAKKKKKSKKKRGLKSKPSAKSVRKYGRKQVVAKMKAAKRKTRKKVTKKKKVVRKKSIKKGTKTMAKKKKKVVRKKRKAVRGRGTVTVVDRKTKRKIKVKRKLVTTAKRRMPKRVSKQMKKKYGLRGKQYIVNRRNPLPMGLKGIAEYVGGIAIGTLGIPAGVKQVEKVVGKDLSTGMLGMVVHGALGIGIAMLPYKVRKLSRFKNVGNAVLISSMSVVIKKLGESYLGLSNIYIPQQLTSGVSGIERSEQVSGGLSGLEMPVPDEDDIEEAFSM